MSSSSVAQRDPEQEIQYWINYVDCALKHPHPLPAGKHAYRSSIDTVPAIKDLYHCLYKLYTEENSSVSFREPVNALALGVFSYYDVVRRPMSLRMVLDRIVEGSHYSTAEQVLEDVALVWANCEAFNGPSSPVTAEAQRCAAALDRIRADFADCQPAPVDEVESFTQVFQDYATEELEEAVLNYFKREDPSALIDNELNLSMLKVKHLRAMKEIMEPFLRKH